MSRDFLTVEDVNTVSYANQGFYWHEIDISKITTDRTEEFTNVKYDCFRISRSHSGNTNTYKVYVDSSLWTKGAIGVYVDYGRVTGTQLLTDSYFTMFENTTYSHSNFKIYLQTLKII